MKISDIKLSLMNPRYTQIDNIDSKLKDMITEKIDDYDEIKIIEKILEREGDYSDLLSLFESINLGGFNTIGDKPILIEKDELIVVAEGNRRMLALKMICDKNIEEYLIPRNFNEFDEDLHYEHKTSSIDAQKNNIEQIKKLLKKIRFEEEWMKKENFILLKYEDLIDDELWAIIYTKHIVGERPGIRKWPRSKYFLDILNFFPSGINSKNEEIKKKVYFKIKRNWKTVIEDFKYAQFIRDFFKNSYKDDDEKNIWKNKMSIAKVSALQTNFAIKRLKSAFYSFSYPDKKMDDYFKVSFTDEYLIKYSGDIDKKAMFHFINTWWSKGAITTRPMKNEFINDFNYSLKTLFENNIYDFNSELSKEQWQNLNLFELNEDQINRIVDNMSADNKYYDFAINAQKLTKTTTKLTLQMDAPIFQKDKQKLFIFEELRLQYIHNAKPTNKFLNAIAVTIRSILEQIVVWGVYYRPEAAKKLINKTGDDVFSDKETKNQWMQYLLNTRTHTIFNDGKKEKNLFFNITDMKEVINNITTYDDEDSKEIATFIIERKEDIEVLNEFIHSSHRVNCLKNASHSIKLLNDWGDVVFKIVEKLDKQKLIDLQTEMIEYIKKNDL